MTRTAEPELNLTTAAERIERLERELAEARAEYQRLSGQSRPKTRAALRGILAGKTDTETDPISALRRASARHMEDKIEY